MADSRPPIPPPNEVERELEFHVEMQTRRFIAAGVPADEARRRAVARMGNVDRVREQCREIDRGQEHDMQRAAWWPGLVQDVRYAWRGLRRAKLFTAAAVATLAIGIGAATAMFSVVYAVLLRGLPYGNANRLAVIWNSYGDSLKEAAIAPAEFADIQELTDGFDGVAALQPQPTSLTGDCAPGAACEPARVVAYRVSPNFFTLLGVQPRLGRPFTPVDGVASADLVVVLTDTLWRSRYGADPAVVGRTVTVGGRPATIVGVMPVGVRFPDEPVGFLKEKADLWVAYRWEQARTEGRGNQYLGMIGRVGEGQSIDAANRILDRVESQFKQAFPNRYAPEEIHWSMIANPLRDQIIGDVRPALFVLFGAVSLLLVIACVNVANLLLARGSVRARELAVRTALGAARPRLVRQLLTETGMIALAGTILGLGLAAAALALVRQLDPGDVPWLTTATLDPVVLVFSIGLTMVTTLLVGLLPAIRQADAGLQSALAEGPRGAGAAPMRRTVRSALVIAEVALAVLVLVGAGLVFRSFTALQRVETGITRTDALVFQVSPRGPRYNGGPALIAAQRDLSAALSAVPGVTLASAASPLPMSGEGWSGTYFLEGQQRVDGQPGPHAEWGVALPGFFSALGISLKEGHDFTAQDTATSPFVVVVDEELARRHWPNESAIGKRIDTDGRLPEPSIATIVGVVSHVRRAGPKDAGEPQIYLTMLQSPARTVYHVVQTSGNALALASAIRAAVKQFDVDLPVARVSTMGMLVNRALARERFNSLMLGVFALVALVLAAVGLYGVISCVVTERSREIGIRLALGGRPAQVLRRVLREGCGLAVGGVAIGLITAFLLSGVVTGLLHDITPADPATYAGVAVLLLFCALAATWIPARRATQVDPVDVLRD